MTGGKKKKWKRSNRRRKVGLKKEGENKKNLPEGVAKTLENGARH